MLPEIGAGGIDLNSALVGVGYLGFVRAYYYIFEILNNFFFFVCIFDPLRNAENGGRLA